MVLQHLGAKCKLPTRNSEQPFDLIANREAPVEKYTYFLKVTSNKYQKLYYCYNYI